MEELETKVARKSIRKEIPEKLRNVKNFYQEKYMHTVAKADDSILKMHGKMKASAQTSQNTTYAP